MVGPAYAGQKLYIPAEKEMDLRCKVKAGTRKKTYTVLIEDDTSQLSSQGSLVAKVLVDEKKEKGVRLSESAEISSTTNYNKTFPCEKCSQLI